MAKMSLVVKLFTTAITPYLFHKGILNMFALLINCITLYFFLHIRKIDIHHYLFTRLPISNGIL